MYPRLVQTARLPPYFFRVIFVGNAIPGCWLVGTLEFSFLPIGSVLSDTTMDGSKTTRVYQLAPTETGKHSKNAER